MLREGVEEQSKCGSVLSQVLEIHQFKSSPQAGTVLGGALFHENVKSHFEPVHTFGLNDVPCHWTPQSVWKKHSILLFVQHFSISFHLPHNPLLVLCEMANSFFAFSRPFMILQTSIITYLSCLISRLNSLCSLYLYISHSCPLILLTPLLYGSSSSSISCFQWERPELRTAFQMWTYQGFSLPMASPSLLDSTRSWKANSW